MGEQMPDRRFCLMSRRLVVAEIALIFALFALQGAWPVPDVNEPYYLGKAIHYWNPSWLAGDFFMESADTHKVFYFTFGWLSLWLTPIALAWTGRLLTWLMLAWAWRRLSVAIVPKPWWSVLTAALFACMMENCHMAGEWVIGGVEAKGFAYVLVFLGLEAFVKNRWNKALGLFGAASAFHVLVGGWSAVATGLAWLRIRFFTRQQPTVVPTACGFAKNLPPLRSLWSGVLIGLLLALFGLIPSLTLDWGADPTAVQRAHEIYVFERLPHHLVLTGIRPDFIVRLALLWGFWLSLPWISPPNETLRRLRAFVAGAVVITWVGVAIHALILINPGLAADLLRFYFFRLTDVALPLGVAIEFVAMLAGIPPAALTLSQERSPCHPERSEGSQAGQILRYAQNDMPIPTSQRPSLLRRCGLVLSLFLASLHFGNLAVDRLFPMPPRSHRLIDFDAWCKACEWVKNSGEIPPDATFITPRLTSAFKWYTDRRDVATWKDVPQDAESIVQWWGRLQDLYATDLPPPEPRWFQPVALKGEKQLKALGAKYRADYLITERTFPPLDLKPVFENRSYTIYRLR